MKSVLCDIQREWISDERHKPLFFDTDPEALSAAIIPTGSNREVLTNDVLFQQNSYEIPQTGVVGTVQKITPIVERDSLYTAQTKRLIHRPASEQALFERSTQKKQPEGVRNLRLVLAFVVFPNFVHEMKNREGCIMERATQERLQRLVSRDEFDSKFGHRGSQGYQLLIPAEELTCCFHFFVMSNGKLNAPVFGRTAIRTFPHPSLSARERTE